MRNKKVSVARRRRAELLGCPSLGRRLDRGCERRLGRANPHSRVCARVPPRPRSTSRRRSPVGNLRKATSRANFRGRSERPLAPVLRHLARTSGVGPPSRLPARGSRRGPPWRASGLTAASPDAAWFDLKAVGEVTYRPGTTLWLREQMWRSLCSEQREWSFVSPENLKEPRRLQKEVSG